MPTHVPHVARVQTLEPPKRYEPDQIRLAFDIAYALNRGLLILCQAPRDA